MRLRGSPSSLAVVLLIAAGTSGPVRAQPVEADYPRFQALVGVDVGYLLPTGEWTRHPYAPVDQFRGGITVGGDVELRPFESLGVAVVGSLSRLDTSDWEKYALLQGDDVNASAYIYHVIGVLRPYLTRDPPNLLKLEIGAGFFAGNGQESFGGEHYDYDFLVNQFTFVIGIQYDRFVGRRTALAFRLPLLVAPDGVQYASGQRHTVVAAPLTLGIRVAI